MVTNGLELVSDPMETVHFLQTDHVWPVLQDLLNNKILIKLLVAKATLEITNHGH